ncbi:ALF repeat-containing protein [Streptomyces sp. NPDC098789]|uniref:ALF repeat-containing protein n=1 Tax=Streptomyces sp. NPDC098789 TaxID=3366098 RepID=UPI003804E6CA
MKLSRIATAVTVAAMAPAVLFASPAFAADAGAATGATSASAASTVSTPADTKPVDGKDQAAADRAAIEEILADPKSGPGVREAAAKALKGTDADLRHFLTVELARQQLTDDTVRVSQLVNAGGKAVQREGKKALKVDTQAALTAFLETGQHEARLEDDRVELLTALQGAGPGLTEGIQKILSNGTAAQIRTFVTTTQHQLRDDDNAVLISTMLGKNPGPELKKAAQAALKGSAKDRAEFLKTGQFTAREKDKKDGNGTGGDPAGGKDKPRPKDDAQAGKVVVTPNNGSGGNTAAPAGGKGPLASTGSGAETPWIVGGSALALAAGAGLVLTARRRGAATRG